MLQPYIDTKEQRGCAYYEYGDPVRKPLSDSEIAFCDGRYDPGILQQVWRLQPQFREEVDEALKVLKSYKKPTIAFHVRGGDKLNEDKAVVNIFSRRVGQQPFLWIS
ncbi:g2761 [Coccomyxa elongata]